MEKTEEVMGSFDGTASSSEPGKAATAATILGIPDNSYDNPFHHQDNCQQVIDVARLVFPVMIEISDGGTYQTCATDALEAAQAFVHEAKKRQTRARATDRRRINMRLQRERQAKEGANG